MLKENSPGMASSSADYGIPPRLPTASTALWTHLMRPGTQTSVSQPDISNLAPPAKPLDKNATSMRILLHDTQAHFENFTVHAAKLLDGVKESRHEIKSVQNLFERDRESLVGDIIDLVNRAQTEIQKAVGSPAQAPAVEECFKDMRHRLSGLEQRLDALQAFNQSHTQALQTQIQSTQILLDKQGTILATLAPLLPLLQAIPLHMDALKAHIQENLLSHKPTFMDLPSSNRNKTYLPNYDMDLGSKRKRSDTQCLTPTGAVIGAPLKRLRTGNPSPSPPQVAVAHQQHSHPQASPLAVRDAPQLSTSARTISPTSKNLTPGQQHQQHATPRRPLMDLLLPLPVRQDTTPGRKMTPRRLSQDTVAPDSAMRTGSISRTSATNPMSGIGAQLRAQMPPAVSMNTNASASTVDAAPLAPQGARPPRILRVQASFTNGVEKKIPPEAQQTSLVSNGSGIATEAAAESGAVAEKKGTGVAGPAVVSRPASSLRLPMRQKEDKSNNGPVFKLAAPNLGQQPPVASSSSLSLSRSSSKVQESAVTAAATNPTVDKARSSTTNVSRIQNQIKRAPLESVLDKTRQTPARETGRRFIALVDSEDEDDDDEEYE